MIQSMTGFGKASLQLSNKKITVEIKSLNSKGLDLNVRMPSLYREMELILRNQMALKLERGKVDCVLYVENTAEQTTTKINVPVLNAFVNQLEQLYKEDDSYKKEPDHTIGFWKKTELMKMALKMPDVLHTEREELNPKEWEKIQTVIDESIEKIIQFRKNEGAVLEKEFELRIQNIRNFMEKAILLDPERVEAVKNRLQVAINELKINVDDNRFEQELIYYLEKLDITEERVRLTNHLDYFLETMKNLDANGRKLGFIVQEIGREINTMGSKSNHAQMQKLVVMMKDELEKIKEQVLNVL